MRRKYVVLASFLILATGIAGITGAVFQRKETCALQGNILDNKGQSLKTYSSTRATACSWFGFGCAHRCEKWCIEELHSVMVSAELTPQAARIDYSCGARAGTAFGAFKQDALTKGSLTVK
jgi:hypothetical protein